MSFTPDALLEPLDIVNRALARIGSPPLLNLDAEGDLESAAHLIYLTEVEAALGKLRWRFARKTFKLSRLDAIPESGWKYAFQIPGVALGLPERVMTNPRQPDMPLRDFEVEGSEVHCDVGEVWARFTVAVSPTYWPPEFRKALIVGIASALAVPVAHDLNLAAALRSEAYGDVRENGIGGLLGRAIAQDIAASPPREDVGDSNPLVDARW